MSLRFGVLLLFAIAACSGNGGTIDDAGMDATDAQTSGNDAASDALTQKDVVSTGDATNDALAQSGVPPFGSSSKGSGGANNVSGATETAGTITYRLIVPASPAKPSPLLIVFSGTEG